MNRWKILGVGAVALSLTVGLLAPSAGSARKPIHLLDCKQLKGKAKKRCLKAKRKKKKQGAVPAPGGSSGLPSGEKQGSSISLNCTDCAPFGLDPIAHAYNSSITYEGTLSPAGAGTVTITYRPGIAGDIVEDVPVDAAGHFSKTWVLNGDSGFNNGFNASFAGDAARNPTSAFQTFYQYG